MKYLLGSMLFIVPGLAMAFVGLRHVAVGRASPEWPSTSGVVQRSSIEQRRSRRSITYHPIVSYRYQLGGTAYIGHQIRYSSTSYNDAQGAQEHADRYAEGSTIQVHYSPGDPSESVLEPGLAGNALGNAWILPAFGGLFLVFGVSGLIQGWRFRAWMRHVGDTNYSKQTLDG
jgi:hypothetical protein